MLTEQARPNSAACSANFILTRSLCEGAAAVDIGRGDRELVASEPGHDVLGPRDPFHRPADGLEHLVAQVVPVSSFWASQSMPVTNEVSKPVILHQLQEGPHRLLEYRRSLASQTFLMLAMVDRFVSRASSESGGFHERPPAATLGSAEATIAECRWQTLARESACSSPATR